MKKTIFVLLMIFSATFTGRGEFFDTVTNLWFTGARTNVLVIGEARLETNSADMAGLIIRMAYDEEFLNLGRLSNSVQNAILVGATVTNANFAVCYPTFTNDVSYIFDFLNGYAPTNLASERAKGLIPNKPFIYDTELKALQMDGLFR